ncbi:YY1-associated factor 2-like [Amphiura filiformis]|uniref:YY1-associated factor 2-like n=1 Tax=Amphiura filiformis TaxID=82378 RepID=UPI003B20CE6C
MREHHSRRGGIMDHRRSPSGRPKRTSRSPDAGRYWDCSVCTFRNNAEAFKCDMCDTRKGTSTRKPRINAQLVAQQQAQQYLAPTLQGPKVLNRSSSSSGSPGAQSSTSRKPGSKRRPRLKNVDRSSGITTQVVVNNIPILITEYAPKAHTKTSPPEDDRGDSSSDQSSQVNGM